MQMNNWTEPLTKHTKLKYEECYAKVVLEELYPEEFVNLQIKDKPDLQTKDEEFGVEVTIAEDKDQLRAESIYTDINYNKIHNKTRALEVIKKCGCKLEGGILSGKSGTDSFNLILSAFENKLEKLKEKDYIYFKWNCLFVFSSISANERMIIDAVKDMQQMQIGIVRQFHKVFVLVPGYCYCLNLYLGSYEIHPIESRLQSVQANKARKIVEAYDKH